jgi:glycerol-3-phosphate O-acyltransferase
MSGIFQSPPSHHISHAMQKKIQKRCSQFSDEVLFMYLADTVYQERKRIEDSQASDMSEQYKSLLQSSARALQRNREAMDASIMNLVDLYSREIHTQFSPRTYAFASKMLPNALTRLLTASQPTQIFGADFDPASRIIVRGPLQKIRELSKNHTLVFTPTHSSNLDSPLIGYGLLQAKLPPVIYGAGLNLFSNPLMSFFMSRLGAYTVDRRKRNQLYKDVLKDYSVESLQRGCHSLFYPGGTRSRDGSIEDKIKKGLLGTVIQAWQENIAENKKNTELLIVPCTLSCSLILEAETLIDDALVAEGKARYIIMDDEFSETRTLAAYARKILNLDSNVYLQFGEPLDCVGNKVNEKGISIDPKGDLINRKEYITDRNGKIVYDKQRDQQYTNLLSKQIITSFRQNNIILPTHLVAFAAWQLLCEKFPRLDNVQRALLTKEERTIQRSNLLRRIDILQIRIQKLVKEGQVSCELPKHATKTFDKAIQRFTLYHRNPVVSIINNSHLLVNSRLVLYYGNRLKGYGLTRIEQ